MQLYITDYSDQCDVKRKYLMEYLFTANALEEYADSSSVRAD